MNRLFLAALFAMLFGSLSFAQEDVHSEIEFGFEDPSDTSTFEIELTEETDEGILVAEGSLLTLGGAAFADNPGFITPVEEDENLTVNSGDQVFVRVLDASAPDSPTARGAGYINFYVPGTPGLQTLKDSSGTLEIEGNTPGSNADSVSVFTGDALVSGSADIFLAAGSDGTVISDLPPSLLGDGDEVNGVLGVGQIHNHLGFILSEELASTDAAVGLLLQFSTVIASTGEVVDSEPFFLIFNNGLDEEVFEGDALAAFGLTEILLGDVNQDGAVDFLDISPFIGLLSSGEFQAEADIDDSGVVDFLDISPFIVILGGGGA